MRSGPYSTNTIRRPYLKLTITNFMHNIYRAINTKAVSEYISHASIVVNPVNTCTVPVSEEVKEQQVEETTPEVPAEAAPTAEEQPVKKTRSKKTKE